jgi:mono/diheme cytochrome c family protein
MLLSMVASVFDRSQRRVAAVVISVALLVSACAEEVALPADADPQLVEGAEVFRASCARCHGASGRGGIGPSLQQIETRLDDAAQRDVVVNGRKTMPRFGSTLSESEIDAVVRYTREIL